MTELSLKEKIQGALKAFDGGTVRDSARHLLNTLGYISDKKIDLAPNTVASFLAEFDPEQKLNRNHALIAEWRSVDMLFQLTGEELSQPGQVRLAFSGGQVDNTIIESYLFFAIDLAGHIYTRTQLAGITREVNKRFPMPVMLIFRHGESLTLAIIGRRLNKRDESRDVLEKVTLIKDIAFADPQRAHIDILHDMSLSALYEDFNFHNFVGLHNAWEKCLDTSRLNERFYRDIANWYFWALKHPCLVPPRNVRTEDQRSIFIIRFITRLIFCWFLQEKEGLIPRDFFRRHVVAQWLKDFSERSGTYYKAVLQNLFSPPSTRRLRTVAFAATTKVAGATGTAA